MELRGAAALVTGAGRGIGRAIALELARAGVRVGAAARSRGEIEELAREARGSGGEILPVRADLMRPEDCTGAVDQVVHHFGGLQILVNNAGIGLQAPLAETTDEQWDRVIGTNLSGAFRVTRAALPHLTAQGGHVFMVSSLAGSNAIENMSAYCASKAALDHLAACLMLEVRQQNVKVTTIAPGSVETSFGGKDHAAKPAAWALQPLDVAETIVQLLQTRDAALLSRVEMRPLRPPRRS